MPTCKICGKTLNDPNSARHINSKYHQERLKRQKETVIDSKSGILIDQNDFIKLKKIVLNLEKRIVNIENNINITKNSFKITKKRHTPLKAKDAPKLEKEIIKIIKQRSSLQQIKGNIPLKDLKEILMKSYNLSDIDFEEIILRLYRKQIVDLQPGGSPSDYQLLSPTGKKFYYLIVKR